MSGHTWTYKKEFPLYLFKCERCKHQIEVEHVYPVIYGISGIKVILDREIPECNENGCNCKEND